MASLCVCFQELKSVLPVDDPVKVSVLVLYGYHIPALVVLLNIIMILGHYNCQ